MPNLLSAEQLAQELGVAKSTIYALARQRKIPHVKIGDRVLFRLEKVISALEIEPETDRPTVIRTKGHAS